MDNSPTTEKSTNEEIIDQLVIKVNALEKREVKLPDYTTNFEDLKKWLADHLSDHSKTIEELKTTVSQHNLEYPATKIQAQLDEVKTIVESIPKIIPVKHSHYFDPKSKGWVIAGVVLLIVTAISTGLNAHLWVENNRLQANDIKFRMLRQAYPVQADWAEQHYFNNPDTAESETIRLENEAKERSEATDLANQKEREAKAAKEKLIKLKHH
ncbi:MAG TPA: hypothetical protein VIJ27_09050 [Mucilaginibacter sp.]